MRFVGHREKLMEHGVCIRVIGNLSFVPQDVRSLIAEAMRITKNNTRAFLNVAFSYTCKWNTIDCILCKTFYTFTNYNRQFKIFLISLLIQRLKDFLSFFILLSIIRGWKIIVSLQTINWKYQWQNLKWFFDISARDEITNTVKDIIKGVKNKEITTDDIDENLFNKCLYTHNSEDPDLLIRTSGEVRLSDFLMWQVSV